MYGKRGGDMELNIPENSYDVFRKICKDLQRGVITKAEARNRFAEKLPNGFIDFPPMPNSVISPDDHPGHFPSDVIVGFHIWEDDGGLLGENFKLGDSITLTDHHGLKAQIQVMEQLPRARRDHAEFVGIGTIEGYTASELKEIKIEVVNGHIHALLFTQDSDDYAAFNRFPLWQEALECRRKGVELWESVISDLMQYFMEENNR